MQDSKSNFLVEGLFFDGDDKYMYEIMKMAEGGDISTFIEGNIRKEEFFKKLG